MQGVFDNCY